MANSWSPTSTLPRAVQSWESITTLQSKSGLLSFAVDSEFGCPGRAIKTTPGAMLLVPPGVPHDWWNAGEEDAVVRVEIRPGARFELMILNAFGLAQDGKVDRRGMPNFLQLVVFAREFSDVVRFPGHHA